MTLKQSFVLPIGTNVANDFIKDYEHLGNVGLGVWHFGLFCSGYLISVVSFGTPCFASSRGQLGTVAGECNARILQLCRGATAFHAPRNSASRAIRLALRAIHQMHGGCLVVAYADTHFSEIGTIYQACNAVYTGETDPKGQADYIIHGRRMSGWVVRKRYGTRCRNALRQIDEDIQILPLRSKHRYVLVAGPRRFRRRCRRRLEAFSRPYPKRSQLGIPEMDIANLALDEGRHHGVTPLIV